MRFEVIILGGGIAGASAAYYSLKKGFKTLLIERSRSPNGASARSGGIVTRMQDYNQDIIYAIRAISLINEICRDRSIIHRGFLSIISNEYLDDDLSRYRKVIPDLKVLYPDDVRGEWGYIRMYEDEIALYAPSDMTIEPDRFLGCLWGRIRDIGGEIFTGSEASKLIIRDNMVVGVKLRDGNIIYGDRTISCMGAWSKLFLKYNGIKVKTYLLSIPIFKFNVASDELVGLWDDEAYGYWRPYDTSYLIGGGYDGYIVKNPQEGFGKPHVNSYSLVKEIFQFRYMFKYFEIVDAWTGTVSFTYNRKPIAERCKKYHGLYIIDGLGGEGLVRGPGLAYDIVEMIYDEKDV